MTYGVEIAGAFCAVTSCLHIASTIIAIIRFRSGARAAPRFSSGPGVSIIRPLRGLENHIEDTLRSGFRLNYSCLELIFCAAERNDPVVPLVQRLMAEHPAVPARLMIGNERISDNPKLNNLVKGVNAARHEWLILADSNVLMPPDYVQRALACWHADTGLVCSPPAACQPRGWWGEIEAGFLNSHQARWQYMADSAGFGFAQGKTMLWRRADLDRIGGLHALASEPAEDAAATKRVRALGLRVRLVAPPFPQPVGRRSFREVWWRQARWAQLRRASFPLCFAAEIFTGGIPPMLAAGVVALTADLPVAAVLLPFAMLWYGCEALLAHTAGWPLSKRSPLAWIARDLLLPAIWINAWLADEFVWRGNAVRSRDGGPRLARAARQWLARQTPT